MRIKELGNQEFKTKDHAFEALLKNIDRIISLKKSQVFKSCEKGQPGIITSLNHTTEAIKERFGLGNDYIYPIINTTKYLDSHSDVHRNNIWKRSLSHVKGLIYYVDNHSLKVDDVIAWPEDVNAFTKIIPWAIVGKNYEGETEALIYEIPKAKIVKASALKVIEDNRKVENSVRMQYVTIKIGINSDSKDFANEKAYYQDVYQEIANKDAADELGYFFGIEEAKIQKEGSMVLAGSNDATTTIYNNEESAKGTSSGPGSTTPTVAEYYKNLL